MLLMPFRCIFVFLGLLFLALLGCRKMFLPFIYFVYKKKSLKSSLLKR